MGYLGLKPFAGRLVFTPEVRGALGEARVGFEGTRRRDDGGGAARLGCGKLSQFLSTGARRSTEDSFGREMNSNTQMVERRSRIRLGRGRRWVI